LDPSRREEFRPLPAERAVMRALRMEEYPQHPEDRSVA
jgi:hypothetical protein